MYSLGIKREQEYPGFQHFTLCPTPDPDGVMTFAEGFCDTIGGKVESRWEKCEEGYRYTITVPAGMSATLKLVAREDASILESGKPAEEAEAVCASGYENGRRIYEIGSGHYEFVVNG